MSVDQVKKFLDGVTEYPDTTPIRIGETEVPLGSLRQLTASERTQLADRMKAVETKEAEVNTRQQQVVDLAQRAQAAYQAAVDAQKTVTAQPANNANDPFADPWLQPVDGRFKKTDARIEGIEGQGKQMFQVVQRLVDLYSKRENRRDYEGLDWGKREKRPTLEEMVKYGQDNRIVDSDGVLSIREVWNKMTEADRLEEARKQAQEKGREEGRMEALAARVTAPGVSGPGQAPIALSKKGYNPDTDVLGDLYAEALKDPELRQQIESMGAGVL